MFIYHSDKEAFRNGGFLSKFLYECRTWSKDANFTYERVSWIKCYGVPLHAWNLSFFVYLVSNYGRILKVNEDSNDKIWLDYAQIMIFTPI